MKEHRSRWDLSYFTIAPARTAQVQKLSRDFIVGTSIINLYTEFSYSSVTFIWSSSDLR